MRCALAGSRMMSAVRLGDSSSVHCLAPPFWKSAEHKVIPRAVHDLWSVIVKVFLAPFVSSPVQSYLHLLADERGDKIVNITSNIEYIYRTRMSRRPWFIFELGLESSHLSQWFENIKLKLIWKVLTTYNHIYANWCFMVKKLLYFLFMYFIPSGCLQQITLIRQTGC